MPSRAELVLRADAVGFDPATIHNDSKLEQHIIYLEKNATAVAGTLATGVLTSSGVFQDTETATIGDVTYTFATALSEAKASNTLTVSDQFAEGETVTVDGVTYTFRAAPVSPYDVDIGASAAASLDNLKAAINDTGTEGTTYGTGTAAHPTVTATTNTDTTQVVAAKNFGTYANGFITVETCANGAWADTTLGGSSATSVGVDAVANEVLIGASAAASLDNLKSAINDTGTEGTHYSTGTAAHPQVTATTNTDTAQTVAARDMAVTNGSIATTETCANVAWGAATLASGVADQNAVDATAAAQTSGDANKNV